MLRLTVAACPKRRSLLACACLVACGATPPPITAEPVPSTDRDPPTWARATTTEGATGEPAALTISGGAEQARALFTTLVLAIRDGNEAGIAALLAERVVHAQPSVTHTTWTRAGLTLQILAGAAAGHVEPDVPFAELIDAGTIQVMDVQTHFEGQAPSGIDAGDQVVLFSPSALGRRLLAGLGSRMLVVRPGPTPLVIAR